MFFPIKQTNAYILSVVKLNCECFSHYFVISWSSLKISFQVFCFGIFGFIWYFDLLEIFSTAYAEKVIFVKVYLLVKLCFLFLTVSLDAALLSQ